MNPPLNVLTNSLSTCGTYNVSISLSSLLSSLSLSAGAEWWEIHEVVRKMLFCGLLVYLPALSRAASAILICLISVATLNYVRPHKVRNYFIHLIKKYHFNFYSLFALIHLFYSFIYTVFIVLHMIPMYHWFCMFDVVH